MGSLTLWNTLIQFREKCIKLGYSTIGWYFQGYFVSSAYPPITFTFSGVTLICESSWTGKSSIFFFFFLFLLFFFNGILVYLHFVLFLLGSAGVEKQRLPYFVWIKRVICARGYLRCRIFILLICLLFSYEFIFLLVLSS